MGTRRVEQDGIVVIGGSRGSAMSKRVFRHERLVPFAGEIVLFHDSDDTRGRWTFCVAEWLPSGSVVQGEFICYAVPHDARSLTKADRERLGR
jgi:hypothetical protein